MDAVNIIRSKSFGKPPAKNYGLTINFHPDRSTMDEEPLLLKLAETNEIRNQFQTKTSNGGLTAFQGGDRWRWESRIFNGLYDSGDNSERPVYGSLNSLSMPVGASPRFGSACFKLKEHVLDRTTFCYPDSYFNPSDFALYENVERLVELSRKAPLDILDNYIEAHIHGKLTISEDVESVVLDPVFKNTEVEKYAEELPCNIEWHSGFLLEISIIRDNPDYRGPEYFKLASKIAVNNRIDPAIIGHHEKLQTLESKDLKKIWHYLARFGYDYDGLM